MRDFLNLQTTFTVLFALIISLSALYFVNDWYIAQTDQEEIFYSQQINNVNKQIFLIGNSHVLRLDPNFIQESLQTNGLKYDVYNIAKTADGPDDRINSLEKIVLAEPELIVYGLDFFSFRTFGNQKIITPQDDVIKNIDIQKNFNRLFSEIISESNFFDLINFENPKLVSLKIITSIFNNDVSATQSSPNQPFGGKIDYVRIMNPTLLENNVKEKSFSKNGRFVDPDSAGFFAMKEILKNLNENNIPVVLFITPYHEIYLNDLSDKDKKTFFSLIEDLENEFNVKVYDLHDKYSDKNIWWDSHHIARDAPGGLIFSEDIAKIILDEVK